jgi:hypothetical protein
MRDVKTRPGGKQTHPEKHYFSVNGEKVILKQNSAENPKIREKKKDNDKKPFPDAMRESG